MRFMSDSRLTRRRERVRSGIRLAPDDNSTARPTDCVTFQSKVNGAGRFRRLRLNMLRSSMGGVAMGRFRSDADVHQRSPECRHAGAVCEKLLGITSAFGLTALMAGTVPQPGTPTGRQKDHVLLCDWPVEWLERYVARNYVDHDPVVSHMKQLQAPFQWRDAAEEITCGPGRRSRHGRRRRIQASGRPGLSAGHARRPDRHGLARRRSDRDCRAPSSA